MIIWVMPSRISRATSSLVTTLRKIAFIRCCPSGDSQTPRKMVPMRRPISSRGPSRMSAAIWRGSTGRAIASMNSSSLLSK